MADVSKIKLPNGTTYDIKDNVSGYTTNTGTITKVQTTAGAHTTINVSSGAAAFNVPTKTSHLTNDSGFITNAGVTGVKGNAESSYRTGQVNLTAANIGAVSKSDELLTTNPFAPSSLRGPYISKIDNAFYAADKRWTVTATVGSSISNLFDGSYDTNFVVPSGQTSVITMDFSNESTGYFPGYAYGYILVSVYYTAKPSSISCRAYCNYEPHGIGWFDIPLDPMYDNSDSQIVYRGRQGRHNISQIEFTIVGQTTGTYNGAFINQIEMHLDRPDSSRTPFLSKYGPETLYYDLTAPNFIGNLTGNVQATTINGVTVGSSPKFTDTNTKVTQTAATASSYTYWRPLVIGMSAGSSAGFTPSTTTDTTYTFNTLEVQPSTGSIRVGNLVLYKGSYTATLTPETLTANRTITIPNNTGTMALTSDIPSVPAWALESSKPSYTFSEIGSKPTTISGYGITDAYTKTEVDNKVSAVLRYKGVKATVANLPTTGNTTGDVWHVTATSGEYAWDGTEWQELGTAISIPAATGSATTGISIADHSSTSIYGVSSSTTSVTGVSGSTSVYGVKSGTNSTTTASKASGANGTAPTLGTAISIYGVKSGTGSTTTASHVKSGGNGTAPTLGTAISLIGVQSSTTTASKVTVGSHSTDYGVKSAGSGSFTQGTFNGGSGSASLTFTMDTTDTKKLVISFSHTHTPATHGTDSHTHTAPTLGSKVPTVSASDVTVPIKNASATSIPNVTSAGSASTWVFEDITVPIRADSATSIPNVTSVGSASTWSFTDVTVPIRADSATTVPTAASSATTVPIKNGTATTVITSKTHSVTDNGHTHTI